MTELVLPYIKDGFHYGITFFLAAILIYLGLIFNREFYRPGKIVKNELTAAIKSLKALKTQGSVLDLDLVRDQVMKSHALQQCWDEYKDTLHGQKRANAQGVLEVIRYRSTSLANNFFTEQIVISAPLKSEFYKHLPGILTGIGIIGTFFGLIFGLMVFDVSKDADQVRASLKSLLLSVGSAFVISLLAIILAMRITWIEKKTINALYTDLDELCALIDSLFEAGAGEEYLQRLVEAAETSATQAMQMKESIVTDLKQVLTELTNQQIASMSANSVQLSQAIGTSITEGLAGPLEKISNAVQTVGDSQGEGVTKLLTDVMGRFVTEMDGMFGSQMRGMNEMMVQTAATIQTASQRFEQLADQIQQAGSGAADAMSKRMEEALIQMQASQARANENMQAFVDHLKDNISKGQTETTELTKNLVKELSESTTALVRSLQDQTNNAQNVHLDRQAERDEQMNQLLITLKESVATTQAESSTATVQMLNQLSDTTASLVKKLEEQAEKAQQEQERRSNQHDISTAEFIENMKTNINQTQNESAAATANLLGQLGEAMQSVVKGLQDQGNQAQIDHASRMVDLVDKITAVMNQNNAQVSRLNDAVAASTEVMRDSIGKLQTTTNANVEKMGSGAELLHGASIRLTENLNSVKQTTDGLGANAKQLADASSALANSLNAIQQVLLDQKSVRDALGMMVSELKTTIENAKKDAGLSSALVENLEKASSQLQKAQLDAGNYLSGVSDVLAEVHAVFATQLKATLNEGNRTFQTEIAQATSHLKGAIQDLGDVLDSIPSSSK